MSRDELRIASGGVFGLVAAAVLALFMALAAGALTVFTYRASDPAFPAHDCRRSVNTEGYSGAPDGAVRTREGTPEAPESTWTLLPFRHHCHWEMAEGGAITTSIEKGTPAPALALAAILGSAALFVGAHRVSRREDQRPEGRPRCAPNG